MDIYYQLMLSLMNYWKENSKTQFNYLLIEISTDKVDMYNNNGYVILLLG